MRSLIDLSNIELWFVFLSNLKSLKSNQGATQQLIKVNSPVRFAACQDPDGIIANGLFESRIEFLLAFYNYLGTINSEDHL